MMNAEKKNIGKWIKAGFIAVFLILMGLLAYKIRMEDLDNWYIRYERPLADVMHDGVDRGESPIPTDMERDYGKSGYQQVSENENYILYVEFTTGKICIEEKATQKMWYSNPDDMTGDSLSNQNKALNSQISIQCMDMSSYDLGNYNNYDNSILLGGMEYTMLENGVRFDYAFPEVGIIIPVQYCLYEDGFTAEVLTTEIRELWNNGFILTKVDLLAGFGAGKTSDEGYLFVPDGSGALIEFNNNKQRFQQYKNLTYGDSLSSKETAFNASTQTNRLPVFGLKCNENAFLAVITSGEGEGIIYASTSGAGTQYNIIYSGFEYRNVATTAWDKKGASFGTEVSEILMGDTDYCVYYQFLEPDSADYSGMSLQYREYLQDRGLLKQSDLAGKNHLILDIYGAVTIEKKVLGVNVPMTIALTTYNDVCRIVEELKVEGIENIIVNYIGALNGGFESKILTKVSPESCLGTKDEFYEMMDYLNSKDVLLFIETNPVVIYESGNGYRGNRDGVKTFFGEYAYQYNYRLDTHEAIEEERSYILTPRLVPGQMKDFSESAAANDITNISVFGIGNSLYQDTKKGKNLASRTDCMNHWINALEDTEQHTRYLMVHGGNAYSLPYADVVTDVAGVSSDYDVEDHDVPFYQMAVGNHIVVGTTPINASASYEGDFLKTIESGSCLKFNLIAADGAQLLDSKYNYMSSYSYTLWKEQMVEMSLKMQDISQNWKGQSVIEHGLLDENVTITIYEGGTCIIVNHRSEPYKYQGHVIDGKDYFVVEGVK